MNSVFLVIYSFRHHSSYFEKIDSAHATEKLARRYVEGWNDKIRLMHVRFDAVAEHFFHWSYKNPEPELLDAGKPYRNNMTAEEYAEAMDLVHFKHEVNLAVYNDAMDVWKLAWYEEYKRFFQWNKNLGEPHDIEHGEVWQDKSFIPVYELEIKEVPFYEKAKKALLMSF